MKKIIEHTENYFELLFNNLDISILILDCDFNIKNFNNKTLKLFNYTKTKLLKINLKKLFDNKFQKEIDRIKNNFIKNNDKIFIKTNSTAIKSDYSNINVELSIKKQNINNKISYLVMINDISKYHNKEKVLKYQAFYDQLTGIPNRILFFDRAENALNQTIRTKDSLCLFYIDIDEFKSINDNYGHETGDLFLKSISKRFIKIARKTDTVSRIGGDEFTLLMPRIGNYKDASNLAIRILESNKQPIIINNNQILPKISIGISIYPTDGNSIDKLLKNADEAMYKAKKLGNNNYIFYNKKYNKK